MIIFKFCFVILALILSSTAHSADWIEVAKAHDGTIHHYIDKSSIIKNKQSVKLWKKTVFSEQLKESVSIPYQSEKSLLNIKCNSRTFTIFQIIRYSDADSKEQVESYTFKPKEIYYADIVPDSIADTYFNYVCKSSPKKTD